MQYRYVAPLISLRSKWRLTGFSRRFTPKNPVRLHNPFGELPRWGAKNVLPLNLMALPSRGRCPAESNEGKILRTPACLLSLQISAHFTAVNVIDFVSRERV